MPAVRGAGSTRGGVVGGDSNAFIAVMLQSDDGRGTPDARCGKLGGWRSRRHLSTDAGNPPRRCIAAVIKPSPCRSLGPLPSGSG